MYLFIELGRLTSDPVLRTTGTGKTFCTMSVAADTGKKNDAGEKISNFFSVTSWGKDAERVQKYLKKGDPVSVVGQFYARSYRSTDGDPRTSLDVEASKITFLPNPNRANKQNTDEQVTQPRRRPPQRAAYSGNDEGNAPSSDDDDEMPF